MVKVVVGGMGLALLASAALTLALAGCGDDCENGEYRCTGNTLEQCVDGSFTTLQDCTGIGECREHGHCHPPDNGHGGEGHGGSGGMHMGGMGGAGGS